MADYDELKNTIENYKSLLYEALQDLAKNKDCKNCANVAQCSAKRIARHFAYRNCFEWQWRSANKVSKAS